MFKQNFWIKKRESIIEFLPPKTIFWFKNLALCNEVIDQYYHQSEQDLDQIRENSGDSGLIVETKDLFITSTIFIELLKERHVVEFGTSNYFKTDSLYEYNAQPQQSFNKDFSMLSGHLSELQAKGYKTILSGDSIKQFEKLEYIIHEHEPKVRVENIALPLRNGFIDHEEQLVIYTDHQLFERFFQA